MARPPKHDWQALYKEYNAGGYETITSFAEAKGIHPFAVQREFRKLRQPGEHNKTKTPDQTKQNSGTQQNKTEPAPTPFPGQCEANSHKTGQRCQKKAKPGERFCAQHLDGWPGQCTGTSRQTGERCRKPVEPGKTKCRFHGGKNMGPKPGEQRALKYGFFAKIFPDSKEIQSLVSDILEKSPLDIIWETIVIQYVRIAQAQKIMHVKNQDDLTKVLKREKESSGLHSDGWEKEYELQFAWDKHASFLKAQSAAMKTLDGLIARYEEMIQKGNASEEHKLRLEKLKQDMAIARERMDLEKAKASGGTDEPEKDDGFIDALKAGVADIWAGDGND